MRKMTKNNPVLLRQFRKVYKICDVKPLAFQLEQTSHDNICFLYKNIIDCDSSDILKNFIQRHDENVLYVILYSHIINICRKCTLNVAQESRGCDYDIFHFSLSKERKNAIEFL